MQGLQRAYRQQGIELMYTVIESLTRDGRDRSRDYKITGFNVPRGAWDAQVLEVIKPLNDEIIFSKTSSSVFILTNIQSHIRQSGQRISPRQRTTDKVLVELGLTGTF